MAADAPNRLDAFDGLQAIAALSVFGLLHAVYQIAVAQPGDGLGGWWFPWAVHLDVGVSIFFAISGFLLYRPFLRATLGGGSRVDVRAYAWVAGTFAASLALATASYWLVERPCLRLRTLVPGRARAATVDAVQAAP